MTTTGKTKATHLDPKARQFLSNAQRLGSRAVQGVGCTDIAESLPDYEEAPCEKVYEGKNNAYIVLGRDRPGTEFSGCGGRGDTQCGMVDIVAGRVSSVIMQRIKASKPTPRISPGDLSPTQRAASQQQLIQRGAQSEKGINTLERGLIDSDTVVDNNFFADAARVYITQRAINIDEYLGFKNTKGSPSDDLSSVVVKADCTRIVGRESVRIYAGGARADGFPSFGEPRADGSDIVNPRIELIVGNQGEDTMQPAVLGKNLVSYLVQNTKIQDSQLKILKSIIKQISEISIEVAGLTLGATSGAALTRAILNIENFRDMLNKTYNDAINEFNHLDTAVVPGSKSILSDKVYIT